MSATVLTEQPGLFDQWEQDQEERERAEAKRRRTENHIRSRRICWPEWDGPEVGGLCSVAGCIAQKEDGSPLYCYTETCRLLELRPDGSWLAVIEMGEVWGKPWPWDGTRLILEETDIWAPTRQLWAARDAASNPVEK